MKDFRKLLKLTWKRYAIWLILVGFFITLSNTLGVKSNLKWDAFRVTDNVRKMERYIGEEKTHSDDQKIDEKYLKEAEKTAQAFAKKYKLRYREEMSYDEEYMEKLDKDDLWEKQSTYEEFMRGMENLDSYKLDMTEKLTSSMALSLVFIMIISMGLTSIEESLNYYDFTRMLPWSKKREFLMKIGVALVFGLALFTINTLMVTITIKGSALSEIASFAKIGTFLMKSMISMVSASLVGVSLGLLAGNFLGHIGLGIIAIGFMEWFKLIIYSFLAIFGNTYPGNFNDAYYNFKKGLSPAGQVFLSLINADFEKISTLWAGLAVALIIAIGTYFLIGRSSAERSGYMVKNKVLSQICKWAGILSLTSILFVIIAGLISSGEGNIILRILSYALSLLISYKLFDILFKIRLKF
ncbi:hypothetical protein [uncultured Anaerococcus sp.]|uniref:hypothetical protein n=1 Tax=uncultured Anaerococcus sp. TaxID=293428 RepID=UPI0028893D18|nr:hypothetical protein [uncultured Anaerococcus sp.]